MARVLFSRSRYDLSTTYLSSYAALLVEKAAEWGHVVTDLFGDNATNENFGRKIPLQNIFMGFGHGGPGLFTGQNSEPLLQYNINADVMSGKKCFLGSCQTGVRLGPAMVELTCPQYHGFAADFVFNFHPEYYEQGRILEDPYAQPFFDSLLTTGYAILLEKEPSEVYEETIARWNYWWDYWIAQEEPMADDILTWINWNRTNFITITPEGIYAKKAGLPLMNIALPLGAAAFLFLLSKA